MNDQLELFENKEKILEDFRLSVSKVKCYDTCAAQYKFSYIDKLPKKEWEHHILGTFVHEVLENFHIAYINGSTLKYNVVMSSVYKEALVKYKVKLTNEIKQEAKKILDNYLKRLYSIKSSSGISEPSRVIAVEKRFTINIKDRLILTGAIDRIQVDGDNMLHVADYKTTKQKKYLKDDFFQLQTYAYILFLENPDILKIRGSYILLRHNFEFLTREFDREETLKIKDKYEKYAEEILSDKLFRAKPSKLCEYCDFLSNCKDGLAFLGRGKQKTGITNWE